jgi:hypothetical protein
MSDKEKRVRWRGKHSKGSAQGEGFEPLQPEARPPEMAGRQVYPPTGEGYIPQGVMPPPVPGQPQPPVQPMQQPPLVPPQGPMPAQPPVQPQPQAFEPDPAQPVVPPLVAEPPQVPVVPQAQQPAPAPPIPHPPPTVVSQQPFEPQPPAAPVPPEPVEPAVMPAAEPQAPAGFQPPPSSGQMREEPVPPAQVKRPEAQGMYPPGTQVPPGYYMPPPWYPPPYTMPPPYFGYPMPGQTGQIPVVPVQPPGPPESPPLPPVGPAMPPPGADAPHGASAPGNPPGMFPMPMAPPVDLMSLEEPEFESLTHAETSHWRGDLKWIFGIITALFIFLALSSAGLYRVTGPGAAKQVLVPIIENATQVKQFVKKNDQSLRNKARKSRTANIYIPDIEVTVSIKGDIIASLSADDLAERVMVEVERQIYSQGYKQSLPMKAAQGSGEERAKAICVTILSKVNKTTHNTVLWAILIFGILVLAFGVLFVVFCRGWGKAIGVGIAFIAGALPGSLMLRIGHQFIWKAGATGTFKPAANQAMRTMSSLAIAYFDIALAFGALVLLAGVIGAIIARKSSERVPPFTELKQPAPLAAGPQQPEPGPVAEPPANGQGIGEDTESFFLKEE